MIQIVRKVSSHKLDRRHEILNGINLIIAKQQSKQKRQSINPIRHEGSFKVIKDDVISHQCLHSLLQHMEKDVLVVCVILPQQLLREFLDLLVEGRNIEMIGDSFFGFMVEKGQKRLTNTLYLFLVEDTNISEGKLQMSQKLLYNMSMVWIVTETLMKKRWIDWEQRQQLFNKQASLFLLKEGHPFLPEDSMQKLEPLFWSIQIFSLDQLNKRHKPLNQTGNQLTVSMTHRHPYNQLQQQHDQQLQLRVRLSELFKISLKNNYKFSSNLMCVPFIYYINIWMRQEQRTQVQLMQITANSYFQFLEQQFQHFVDTIYLPIDELILRGSLASERKALFLTMKKHLNKFQGLFKGADSMNRYVDKLSKIFSQREEELYQLNTRKATSHNRDILARLYADIIERNFQESGSSDRNLIDYQSDFQVLMDRYGRQSIRVTSQLKTFNDFIMQHKIAYAQNLQRELQTSKPKYINEKQQLKDRLQIQTGVLQTLQQQIKQLQMKRHSIDSENSALKKTITELQSKSNKDSVSNTPLRWKGAGNSVTNRTLHRESKFQYRANKVSRNVEKEKAKCCGCCCLLM